MTDHDDFSRLAELHTLGDDVIPGVVLDVAGGLPADLVWRNELGGLTFRVGDRFIKWNPLRTGVDLQRERDRLVWIMDRHPAPRVADFGSDDDAQWLITEALAGDSAVGDEWRARRPAAIEAIAQGLRAIHAIPTGDFPSGWSQEVWVSRTPHSLGTPPPVHNPVGLVRRRRSHRLRVLLCCGEEADT